VCGGVRVFERTAAGDPKPGRARRARVDGVGWQRWMPTAQAREVLGWWLVSRIALFVLSVSAPLLFNRGNDYPNVWHAWLQWDVWHLNAVAEFGIDTGHPCLDHCGGILLAKRAGHLEGKTQALLGVAVDFAAGHPAVDGADVLHFADVCGQFAAEDRGEAADDLGPGQKQRFAVRGQIGAGHCHYGHGGILLTTSVSHG